MGRAAQHVDVVRARGVGELGEQSGAVVEERGDQPFERRVVGGDRAHPGDRRRVECHLGRGRWFGGHLGGGAARSCGRGGQGGGEFLGADRLGEVVVHTGGDARLAVALHGVGGHGDDPDRLGAALGRDRPGADAAGGLQTVHLRHLHVHQHEVVRELLDGLHRFDAVRGDVGAVPHRFEHQERDLLVDGVVLGQQHPQRVAFAELGGRRHPTSAVTTLPASTSVSTDTSMSNSCDCLTGLASTPANTGSAASAPPSDV